MYKYQKSLNRLRGEAEKILKQYRAPTSLDEFMGSNYEFKDRVCMAAWGVVFNAEQLEQEIERGRMHHALDRLLAVCESYEDLWVYDATGEDPKKVLLTHDVLKSLSFGHAKRRQAATVNPIKDKQQRYQEIRDFVWKKAVLIANPRQGEWTRLKENASRKFKVSSKTIERAFKGHDRPFK